MKSLAIFLLILAAVYSIPPNIVIILGDDMGWDDFGFHGSTQIPTPNIDALAYNGVIMNRFYTHQSSLASRIALFTGKNPPSFWKQRYSIEKEHDLSFMLKEKIITDYIRNLGYWSHAFGKWHLGKSETSTKLVVKGFESFLGYFEDYCGFFYHDELKFPGRRPPLIPFKISHEEVDPIDVFTDKISKVIVNHHKKESLFLYLSYLMAHTGLKGTYGGLPDVGESEKNFKFIKKQQRRRYAGIVQKFDASIGKIVKTLADEKMLNNTIIVFLSDSGAHADGPLGNYGSNWPLRGQKNSLYEGAVRGTAVIYSTLLKEKRKINDNLIHISDLFPTLYSAAGGALSDLGEIDGKDQWQSLRLNVKGKRTEIVVNDERGRLAMIFQNGKYKLHNGTAKDGVYDGFYGDENKRYRDPIYSLKRILESDMNKAIATVTPLSEQLKEEAIWPLRKSLDLGNKCSKRDMVRVNGTHCQGFCLYDLFVDPCEAQDLANNLPDVVQDFKKKMGPYGLRVSPINGPHKNEKKQECS